jgi:hypothetical protein
MILVFTSDETTNAISKMGGKRRNLSEFKRLSAEKFGVGTFNFDEFNYVDMKTKGLIICPCGHRNMISPVVHLRGDGGCRDCANIKTGQRFADTQEGWIRKARAKHGEKYGYEKVKYLGQGVKVIITCRTCNEDFEQDPTSHATGGCGCPTCGIESSRAAKFLTDDDIIKILEECASLHLVKYEYLSKSLENGRLMIQLLCPSHGPFKQRLDHHRKGHGCVKCCSSVSRCELEWIAYLTVAYASHSLQTQYKIESTKYAADAYCKDLNRIFEFHGDFWHGNPAMYSCDEINPRTKTTYGRLYAKTLAKHDIYEKLGFAVSFVWESDWLRAKRAVVTLQRVFRSRTRI